MWFPPPLKQMATAFSFDAPGQISPRDDYYELIHYAETNYGTGAASRVSVGLKYARQKIDYHERYNVPCPFARDRCLSNNSALLLDTGFQSSRVLGVNTAKQYHFRRQAICTPLKIQHSNKIILDQSG